MYGQNQNLVKGLDLVSKGPRGVEKMKSFVVRTLGLALLGLALVSSAFADGITLSGNYPGGYISYTFTDQVTQQSVQEYVSPYTATSTINGVTVASQFGCLDINNPTNIDTFYSGTFGYAVTTADDEVSWLADQLAGTTPSNPLIINGVNESGPISMAIWEIEFSSSNKSDGKTTMPIDPAAAAWIEEAKAAVEGGYQSDSVFFTPEDPKVQRFVEISLTSKPGTTDLLAPEPSSLILLGSGLLGLAGLLRRRRHSA
jgi:hypothetical protein